MVKDIISTQCELPADIQPSDISVFSAVCTGGNEESGYTFGAPAPEPTATVTINGSTVDVTGFDYGANWVGWNSSTGQYHGKKLIVEIPFEVKPGALVGKDISQLQTNGPASGLYENSSADTPIDPFPIPKWISFIDLIVIASGLNVGESARFHC